MRRTAVVLALVLLGSACAGTHKYDPLPVPDAGDASPTTSSTIAPRLDEVQLPAVPGSTTSTVAMGPGPVTIVGRVDGPDGPLSGARVRLERLAGDGVATVEVPTGPDGSWNVQNVLGGRYRVRAYQAPSFGMTRAQVVFVDSPRAKPIILRVDRFEGTRIDAVIAPQPPVVDSPSNLKVRVTVRGVDSQGIVRSTPRASAMVTLSGTGSWSLSSSNPSFTDAAGEALFQLTCLAAGAQPLTVMLDTGETQALDLPACA